MTDGQVEEGETSSGRSKWESYLLAMRKLFPACDAEFSGLWSRL